MGFHPSVTGSGLLFFACGENWADSNMGSKPFSNLPGNRYNDLLDIG